LTETQVALFIPPQPLLLQLPANYFGLGLLLLNSTHFFFFIILYYDTQDSDTLIANNQGKQHKRDLPSAVIEAKAEDLARTLAGALNHKDKLIRSHQTIKQSWHLQPACHKFHTG
jgi:hypothetical protein